MSLFKARGSGLPFPASPEEASSARPRSPKAGPSPDPLASPHLARLVELLLQPRHRHAACRRQASRSNSGFRRRRRTDFFPPRAGRAPPPPNQLASSAPPPRSHLGPLARTRGRDITWQPHTSGDAPLAPHPTLQRHPRALRLSARARPLQDSESIAAGGTAETLPHQRDEGEPREARNRCTCAHAAAPSRVQE